MKNEDQKLAILPVSVIRLDSLCGRVHTHRKNRLSRDGCGVIIPMTIILALENSTTENEAKVIRAQAETISQLTINSLDICSY